MLLTLGPSHDKKQRRTKTRSGSLLSFCCSRNVIFSIVHFCSVDIHPVTITEIVFATTDRLQVQVFKNKSSDACRDKGTCAHTRDHDMTPMTQKFPLSMFVLPRYTAAEFHRGFIYCQRLMSAHLHLPVFSNLKLLPSCL